MFLRNQNFDFFLLSNRTACVFVICCCFCFVFSLTEKYHWSAVQSVCILSLNESSLIPKYSVVLSAVETPELLFPLIFYNFYRSFGTEIAQWLERRTRDWKVAGSSPRRNGGRIFFSPESAYFGIRSTPVLPQQYVKDPGHSAKVQVAGYS